MELANWNKIKAKRFELNVEGYTETDGEEPYFLTPYFGVLPENVDAIRAVLNTTTREESIKKTNDSLCIGGPTS